MAAHYFMIATSHPLETHITPSPCILKVFDILYVVSVHMVVAKHDRLECDGLCYAKVKWNNHLA
jgi:hypothetical protein